MLRSIIAMMEQRIESSQQQKPVAPAQAISTQEPTLGNEGYVAAAQGQPQQTYMPPSDQELQASQGPFQATRGHESAVQRFESC